MVVVSKRHTATSPTFVDGPVGWQDGRTPTKSGMAWLLLHTGYSVALTVTRRTAFSAWSPLFAASLSLW